MKSNLDPPIWPYLGVLACLFLLALGAPRQWHRLASDSPVLVAVVPSPPLPTAKFVADDARFRGLPATRGAAAREPEEVATPKAKTPNKVIRPQFTVEQVPATSEPRLAAISPDVASEPTLASPEPTVVQPEPNLAEVQRVQKPLADGPQVVVESPRDRLAMRPTRPSAPAETGATPGQSTLLRPSSESLPGMPLAEWTPPGSLLKVLAELQSQPPSATWSSAVSAAILRLVNRPHAGAQEVEAVLDNLRTAEKQAGPLADSIDDLVLQTNVLRARYALRRRIEVWELVSVIRNVVDRDREPGIDHRDLGLQVVQAVAAIGNSESGRHWQRYLLLDKLQSFVGRETAPSAVERAQLARAVLARMDRARGDEQRDRFLASRPLQSLETALRRWSATKVDTRELLAAIEAHEHRPTPATSDRLAAMLKNLTWSSQTADQQLAKKIDQHYRNANLRVAVTGNLLNRWLPEQQALLEPVRDRILGADVAGRSLTETDIKVRMLPDEDQLRLGLEVRGVVSTDTASNSGPATFYSEGRTTFLAQKLIVIDRDGLRTWPAVARASSRNQLVSVGTDYDNVPFLRSFVRNIARNQHSLSEDEARRTVEDRVAARARTRLDQESDPKIREAEERVKSRVWSLLDRLVLQPTPLDLYTTKKRMVMRLRLANDQQMGAYTPRPRAPADSLASIQLHESAFNNALAQLELDGKTFLLPELYAHLGKRLDTTFAVPEDLPGDVAITFVSDGAVRVRCEEGRVKVTLALAKIDSPRGDFSNIRVAAFYRPVVRGMQTELARDSSIRLEGKRLNMRNQIVLRGVFAKVFSKRRRVPVIPAHQAASKHLAKLKVIDLVIDDGWIGMAIGPKNRRAKQSKIASRPRPAKPEGR